MHVQGGNRGDPVAEVDAIVHEGDGLHEAEVVEATAHTATLEYLEDGRKITVSKGEFDEIFEY